MTRFSRRTFLRGTAGAAAVVTIAGTKSSGRVLGANDTVRVGVAGIRGRGGDHVSEFVKMNLTARPDSPNVQEQACC